MKRINFRKMMAAAAVTAALMIQTGCSPAPATAEGEVTVLTIGTADSGGTMYPVGSAIADVLEQDDLKINVSASSGSAMNAGSLVNGEVDLALVSGDTARAAYQDSRGKGKSLRAIGAVFLSQSNWMVAAESGLQYVHELDGLRLGVGPEHSGTEMSAMAAIDAVGLDPEETETVNCGIGAGTALVMEGELDAIHGFSGAPISALEQAAAQAPIRILSYTSEELNQIFENSSVFVPVTLPAGTYKGQEMPVDTFGVKCLLCVDESMDEELVYHLTRALWEAREELGSRHPAMKSMQEEGFVSELLPVPLHEGAGRFYTELTSAG